MLQLGWVRYINERRNCENQKTIKPHNTARAISFSFHTAQRDPTRLHKTSEHFKFPSATHYARSYRYGVERRARFVSRFQRLPLCPSE